MAGRGDLSGPANYCRLVCLFEWILCCGDSDHHKSWGSVEEDHHELVVLLEVHEVSPASEILPCLGLFVNQGELPGFCYLGGEVVAEILGLFPSLGLL